MDIGMGRWVEVALCGRTPYYSELVDKFRSAKDYWGLSDAALAPYELRLVPDWFNVILSHEPWEEVRCMGVVAMDVREIRVSLRRFGNDDWVRTLAHEFGHIYCHEHPELGLGWDPRHKATEVWAKANAYCYTPKTIFGVGIIRS